MFYKGERFIDTTFVKFIFKLFITIKVLDILIIHIKCKPTLTEKYNLIIHEIIDTTDNDDQNDGSTFKNNYETKLTLIFLRFFENARSIVDFSVYFKHLNNIQMKSINRILKEYNNPHESTMPIYTVLKKFYTSKASDHPDLNPEENKHVLKYTNLLLLFIYAEFSEDQYLNILGFLSIICYYTCFDFPDSISIESIDVETRSFQELFEYNFENQESENTYHIINICDFYFEMIYKYQKSETISFSMLDKVSKSINDIFEFLVNFDKKHLIKTNVFLIFRDVINLENFGKSHFEFTHMKGFYHSIIEIMASLLSENMKEILDQKSNKHKKILLLRNTKKIMEKIDKFKYFELLKNEESSNHERNIIANELIIEEEMQKKLEEKMQKKLEEKNKRVNKKLKNKTKKNKNSEEEVGKEINKKKLPNLLLSNSPSNNTKYSKIIENSSYNRKLLNKSNETVSICNQNTTYSNIITKIEKLQIHKVENLNSSDEEKNNKTSLNDNKIQLPIKDSLTSDDRLSIKNNQENFVHCKLSDEKLPSIAVAETLSTTYICHKGKKSHKSKKQENRSKITNKKEKKVLSKRKTDIKKIKPTKIYDFNKKENFLHSTKNDEISDVKKHIKDSENHRNCSIYDLKSIKNSQNDRGAKITVNSASLFCNCNETAKKGRTESKIRDTRVYGIEFHGSHFYYYI